MIELEFHIPLSPKATWERLTEDTHLQRWWGEGLSIEAHEGGHFFQPLKNDEAPSIARGKVTAFEPLKRLQLNYHREEWPGDTRLEFLLSEALNGDTLLYVQHSGWDIILDETLRNQQVDRMTQEWQKTMSRFVHYCTDVVSD